MKGGAVFEPEAAVIWEVLAVVPARPPGLVV